MTVLKLLHSPSLCLTLMYMSLSLSRSLSFCPSCSVVLFLCVLSGGGPVVPSGKGNLICFRQSWLGQQTVKPQSRRIHPLSISVSLSL